MRVSTLVIVYRRQILTTKVDPRSVNVKYLFTYVLQTIIYFMNINILF